MFKHIYFKVLIYINKKKMLIFLYKFCFNFKTYL